MDAKLTPASAPQADLVALLTDDHQHLHQLFDDVLAAFNADARAESAALWQMFEHDLEAHMGAEEELILPELARTNPTEAAALRQEHESIRRRLLELGVGVDLHLTRVEIVEAFIDELRQHAAREQQLLYRWAAQHLDAATQHALQKRLRRKSNVTRPVR